MPTESDRDFLKATGWLSKSPAPFQDAVLAKGFVTAYSARKVVYRPNDPPGGIFGIIAGRASVSTVSAREGLRLSHVLRPGSWFGSVSIPLREPRGLSVEALTPLQIFVLPYRVVDQIVADEFIRHEAWKQFCRLVVSGAEFERGTVRDLTIRDARIRCVATILRLCGYRHSDSAPEEKAEIELVQEELAHLSNLSRNATGIFLRELANENVIELAYGRLKVLDPANLSDRVRQYEHDDG